MRCQEIQTLTQFEQERGGGALRTQTILNPAKIEVLSPDAIMYFDFHCFSLTNAGFLVAIC